MIENYITTKIHIGNVLTLSFALRVNNLQYLIVLNNQYCISGKSQTRFSQLPQYNFVSYDFLTNYWWDRLWAGSYFCINLESVRNAKPDIHVKQNDGIHLDSASEVASPLPAFKTNIIIRIIVRINKNTSIL